MFCLLLCTFLKPKQTNNKKLHSLLFLVSTIPVFFFYRKCKVGRNINPLPPPLPPPHPLSTPSNVSKMLFVVSSMPLVCTVKVKSVAISELRSCVKVEVEDLGSPSLIVRTVSVDVKQHFNNTFNIKSPPTHQPRPPTPRKCRCCLLHERCQ